MLVQRNFIFEAGPAFVSPSLGIPSQQPTSPELSDEEAYQQYLKLPQ